MFDWITNFSEDLCYALYDKSTEIVVLCIVLCTVCYIMRSIYASQREKTCMKYLKESRVFIDICNEMMPMYKKMMEDLEPVDISEPDSEDKSEEARKYVEEAVEAARKMTEE